MTTDLLAIIALDGLGFLLSPLVMVLVTGLTAFWIWMFVDCARCLCRGDNRKRWWIIAIAITHTLGALAYFLFGRCGSAGVQGDIPTT
jgi:hypothetical protein